MGYDTAMTNQDELLTQILAELRGIRSDLQAQASPPHGEMDMDAAEMARLAGASLGL